MKNFACLSLLAALAPLAAAQDRPQVSTREQLRTCLEEGDRLEAERLVIESAILRMESGQKDLQSLLRLHAANRARVDLRQRTEVDAYNRKGKDLQTYTERQNVQATSLLGKRNEFNARIADVNVRCAGMVVRVDDHEDILLERVKQILERDR